MSRISCILEWIGGLSCRVESGERMTSSLEGEGEFYTSLTWIGQGLFCGITRIIHEVKGLFVSTKRVGGIQVSFTQVGTDPSEREYLEIEPEVIWVYYDLESMNDVFSNTNWNIN